MTNLASRRRHSCPAALCVPVTYSCSSRESNNRLTLSQALQILGIGGAGDNSDGGLWLRQIGTVDQSESYSPGSTSSSFDSFSSSGLDDDVSFLELPTPLYSPSTFPTPPALYAPSISESLSDRVPTLMSEIFAEIDSIAASFPEALSLVQLDLLDSGLLDLQRDGEGSERDRYPSHDESLCTCDSHSCQCDCQSDCSECDCECDCDNDCYPSHDEALCTCETESCQCDCQSDCSECVCDCQCECDSDSDSGSERESEPSPSNSSFISCASLLLSDLSVSPLLANHPSRYEETEQLSVQSEYGDDVPNEESLPFDSLLEELEEELGYALGGDASLPSPVLSWFTCSSSRTRGSSSGRSDDDDDNNNEEYNPIPYLHDFVPEYVTTFTGGSDEEARLSSRERAHARRAGSCDL